MKINTKFEIYSDNFMIKLGVDPKKLSDEQKARLASEFLLFFMMKVIDEHPEIETKFERYIKEFSAYMITPQYL